MDLTEEQERFLKDKLEKLSSSKFRSGFYLKQKDIEYIKKESLEKINAHAKDIIKKRLAPKFIPNDGKQTPMKNHPVFIAQHATATCCRGCLYKWHHIPKDKELSEKEQKFITSLIIYWIKYQLNKNNIKGV